MHFDEALPAEIRAGILQTLQSFCPSRPVSEFDNALGSILAIRKHGLSSELALPYWQIANKAGVRHVFEEVIAWYVEVLRLGMPTLH